MQQKNKTSNKDIIDKSPFEIKNLENIQLLSKKLNDKLIWNLISDYKRKLLFHNKLDQIDEIRKRLNIKSKEIEYISIEISFEY